MPVKRGNPPGMKNVRATVYNQYVRVDQPRSMIFVSGQVSRDDNGNQVGMGSMLEQTRQCLRYLMRRLTRQKTPARAPLCSGAAGLQAE